MSGLAGHSVNRKRRDDMKKKNPFRIFWLILGLLCLGLGAVGIVAADSANGALFPGGPVQFYKELPEAS